jgi:LTXXQ motif family protein
MMRASVLLAAVLVVCVASDAQARRRHHGYGGGYESGERGSSRSSLDAWRRARDAQGQNQDQDQNQNQGQTRGQDRGDDRGPTGAQNPNPNLAPGRAPDRGQNVGQDLRGDRGPYRSRYERRRARNLEDWRRAQESGQASGRESVDVPRSRNEWRRARDDARRAREERRAAERAPLRAPLTAAGAGAAALPRGRSGPFGATIDKLVRGCAVQAAEFENWPFDSISEAVAPNEAQRNALTNLRNAANEAAQRLAKDCPQEVPAAPAARLEAVEQGIDAALKAFDVVEPALQAFYSALNDEQKARLYREMGMPVAANAPQSSGRREAQEPRETRDSSREGRDYSSRRHRWRDYAAAREAAARETAARIPPRSSAPGWSGTCAELAGVLRNWPVREIEQGVQLSAQQRVAFYELVTASLKAADTLGSACSAEAALTPVGRMQAMRKRLSAVRAATAAIRAPLSRFYEALDQGQQLRFAGMS